MTRKSTKKGTAISLALLVVLILPQLCLAQQRERARRMDSMWPDFPDRPPAVGEIATDFMLKTTEGEEFTLSEAYAKGPVVIEFGSYT